MERFTVAATSNGSLSQRTMFKGNSFPAKPQLRDTSFSPYLRPEEPKPDRIGRGIDDSEISIFEAETYFKEIQDQKENKKASSLSLNLDGIVDRSDIPSIPRLSSASSVDGYGRNYRTGSFHATPTASSEASWNSQSGLLSNPPGSIAVSMKNLRLDEKKKKGSSSSPTSSSSSSSSSTKWLFGRKCPCSGKKSVQVEEKFSEPKIPVLQLNNSNPNNSINPNKQSSSEGPEAVLVKATMEFDKKLGIDERPKLTNSVHGSNWVKEQEVVTARDSSGFLPENHFPTEIGRRVVPSGRSFSNDNVAFSFPILSPPAAAAASKLLLNGGKPVMSQLEDPPRESLEVFRPTDDSSLRKSTDLQRRVLMSFPEDNDRRSFTFPASPKIRPTDDDVVSDASSDLFEIESFSTQSTMYPMYRRRESLDEISSFEGRRYRGSGGLGHFRHSLDETTTPSIAPTECYEPSEVSIDWSVTTAEGFDRGSITNFSIAAASDYQEDVRFMNNDTKKVTMSTCTVGKRKGNGGLLSCRCEKAVSVGPHPVKSVPAEQRLVGGQIAIESGRINPAMPRLSEMSLMHVGRGSGKPPFARSLSARMSHQALTTR